MGAGAVSPLEHLNALFPELAHAEFLRSCGSRRWAERMVRARPYRDRAQLFAEAEQAWAQLEEPDFLEAFSHHPRIGDVSQMRARFPATVAWSSQEQGGVLGAPEEVLQALAEGNRAYEERFGFLFLICATGQSAAQMLTALQARLSNEPATELRIAAAEQAKIMRLRLERLLSP
jgi:2-oxo-4-hydroxy-4-carboxy-5-ureidoimidazoline decarboxylase